MQKLPQIKRKKGKYIYIYIYKSRQDCLSFLIYLEMCFVKTGPLHEVFSV